MSKVFQILADITILMALFLMLLFGYWMLYPYKPIEYKTVPYPILNENKTVKLGDILKYSVDYCKYTDISPTVVKRYVDGVIYELNEGRGVVYGGCRVQVVDNLVPYTLFPGKYRLEIVIEYQMNPVRKIVYKNYTEEFTLVR